jgi:hypothetical protein
MNGARLRRPLIKKRALESKMRRLEAERKKVQAEIIMYETHALICDGQRCVRSCPNVVASS